jgi:hypothetical protein
MKSPSEATGEEFQRPPQGEFRAPAARKSDDTTEKVQPAGVARAPLSVQMRVFGSLDDGLSMAAKCTGCKHKTSAAKLFEHLVQLSDSSSESADVLFLIARPEAQSVPAPIT